MSNAHDRIAIQDVLAKYCRGIDRLDQGLIAQAYWPEARENHGIFVGRADEFAPWIVRFLGATYRATAHRLGQSYVELAGEAARAETYFSSLHQLRSGDGSSFEAVDGRYVDELERRAGVWKIGSRLVVLDFVRQFESPGAALAGVPGLTFGARAPEDPSCRHFSGAR